MTSKQATELDERYLSRKEVFEVPTFRSLGIKNSEYSEEAKCTYLAGNSLGLLPKRTRTAINDELQAWADRGVESHFDHPFEDKGLTPWMDIDLPLLPLTAPLVGAKENEVAVMGSLTANLNAMLIHFYKPQGKRTKILFEKHAFPSDYYAFLNIVKFHGYDESHLVQLDVKGDETYIKTEKILQAIDEHKEELALVCFPGIQYYTGQLFKIEEITKYAKDRGITVGWDLAHAVGNVPLLLHDWDVDFACWCSYKYLNAGPGGIAGIFVNEKYTKDNSKNNFKPRLAGWWGNNAAERFKMMEVFDPINSALSYRQSNPSVIDCVSVRSSLEVIKDAGGIYKLREKSVEMTAFLEGLLKKSKYFKPVSKSNSLGFSILTPANKDERGAQLSLIFKPHNDDASKDTMERISKYLHNHGVICDERRPDVIRLAPCPLYNSFQEIFFAVKILEQAFDHINATENAK